jgi:hypothetical protein
VRGSRRWMGPGSLNEVLRWLRLGMLLNCMSWRCRVRGSRRWMGPGSLREVLRWLGLRLLGLHWLGLRCLTLRLSNCDERADEVCQMRPLCSLVCEAFVLLRNHNRIIIADGCTHIREW